MHTCAYTHVPLQKAGLLVLAPRGVLERHHPLVTAHKSHPPQEHLLQELYLYVCVDVCMCGCMYLYVTVSYMYPTEALSWMYGCRGERNMYVHIYKSTIYIYTKVRNKYKCT